MTAAHSFDQSPSYSPQAELEHSLYAIPEPDRLSIFDYLWGASHDLGHVAFQAAGTTFAHPPLRQEQFPRRSPLTFEGSLSQPPPPLQFPNPGNVQEDPTPKDSSAPEPVESKQDPVDSMPLWVRQLRGSIPLWENRIPITAIDPYRTLGALALSLHQRIEARISANGSAMRTSMPADLLPIFIEDIKRATPNALLLSLRIEESPRIILEK